MNWKKFALWSGAILAGLILSGVIAVVLVVRTDAFHHYVLAKAQQAASESLGARVQAHDFSLSLFPISIDLNSVEVGDEQGQAAPLLRVDHVHAGIRIVSFIHRKWQLSDVEVDHPVVHVFVDAAGNNNLPRPKTQSTSHTNLFDLAVQRAVLRNGEVYYNDQKSSLDADLHDLDFASSYDPAEGGRYYGDLGYRDGHLRFSSYEPVTHSFQAHFDATRSGMTLSPATLAIGPSHLKASLTLTDYASPTVHGTYDALLVGDQFRNVLKNASLPRGDIRLQGSLQYHDAPGRPLLQNVVLDGKMTSRRLRVYTSHLVTDVTDIDAAYALKDGNAAVPNMRAHLLGGELSAQALVRDLGRDQKARVQASVRGISLADLTPTLNQSLKSSSVRPVALAGTADGDLEATWGRTIDNLVATVNTDVHATVAPGASHQSNAVPVNGSIHARYVAASKAITLTDSAINTPQTAIALNGTVSNRSQLQVRMQSANLHELESLANAFRRPTPGKPNAPLGLYGTASFIGAVTGRTDAPQITGQLQARNLELRGAKVATLRTNVNLAPSLASLQNGVMDLAQQGHIAFSLRAALDHWSLTSTSPIQATVNASQVSVAELRQLAGSTAPVNGILNANLTLRGSESNPIGKGSATLSQGRIASEPLQNLAVTFEGTGEAVHATLNARAPAGTAQANLTYYPKTEQYEATLQAPNVRLDRIRMIANRNSKIAGIVNVTASGRGTIQDPSLQASIVIPRLLVSGKAISDIRLDANVQNKVATLVLASHAINTAITGHVRVALSGDYQAEGNLDTQRIQLAPLLALYSPAEAADFSGETEFHVTFSGPLKNKSLLRARLEVPALAARYKSIQLGEVAPIRANYTNGTLTIEPAEIRGTGTDLQVRGAIPLASPTPASLLLLGTVDLRLLQFFDPTIDSSGQLQFDINSFGDRANLNTQGQIKIVNASLATDSSPIGLQNANGVLALNNDRLQIKSFQGSLGGGDITASGAIIVRPSIQFNLAAQATGVRIPYPQGVRIALDSKLNLTGTTDNSLLQGNARIQNIYFAPDFDPTTAMGQFNSAPAPPSPGGFTQNLRLDLAVQSASMINATSRTFSMRGTANLRVTGTADQPVLLGRVDLNGGDALLFGNRYVIENGTVAFVNAVQTQPVVNLEAKTTIDQYNIQLRLQGPVDRLKTSYTSDPSLPPADIIHLLAFGSTTESAAANPTPGNLGAESVLAQGVTNQVTSRLQKVAGISHLSVDPTLGNNTQSNPGARISVQQRVTSNLFVTFETDVTSTQRDVIQVQYQINPRWSVSTTRDQNGGFGFDVRVHKTF